MHSHDFVSQYSKNTMSPSRSRLMMDKDSREALSKAAKDDYTRRLAAAKESLNDGELREYQKSEILRQSVCNIKARAKEQDFIRHSPRRYN